MNREWMFVRKLVSIGLSATMLTIWISAPLLEQVDLVHDPIVESEHNPSTCPPAHDHTVCTQVVANLAALSGGVEKKQLDILVRVPDSFEINVLVQSAFIQGHPARGPPLV